MNISQLKKRISCHQLRLVEKHLNEIPVKLGKLSSELGVNVKLSSLPINISGQIKKEGNSHIIRINRYETRERQRFTIAHELAHFLLHREIIDQSVEGISDNILYRSGESSIIESEANKLAAEIVMPNALIKAKLNNHNNIINDQIIETLAKDFQVSKAAMEIRLSQLTNF